MNTKMIQKHTTVNARLSLPFFNMRGLSVISAVFILGQFFILNSSSAAELKIGYVNAQRAIEESPQAEKARKQLDKEFSPRNKELEKAKQELRKMEEKLNRDGAIMSEPEQQKLERKIRADARDLKR
ncbi:MAG: OmpH family outer membrane protein, partial [Thiohalomonadales bacterium]